MTAPEIAAARADIAAAPDDPQGWVRLAEALDQAGAPGQAGAFWRAAILAANHYGLYAAAGAAAMAERRHDLSHQAMAAAVCLAPSGAIETAYLALALDAGGRSDPSLAWSERAYRLDPGHDGIAGNLAHGLDYAGRDDEARALYRRHWGGRSDPLARLKAAMTLPRVPSSRDEIAERRAELAHALDLALDDARAGRLRIPEPGAAFAGTTFLLAYHDAGNRDLQRRFAAVCRAACPDLCWTAPAFDRRPPDADERVRIGFVSAFLRDHTVGVMAERLIARLPADLFHKTVFLTDGPEDEVRRRLRAAADRVLALPGGLMAGQRALAAARLDLAVFLDIGMSLDVDFLAHARFAPRQCVTWGHPDTTGIPTFDAFLSTAAMEPPDAAGHYAEPLLALRGLNFDFAPTIAPPDRRRRDELGLPTRGRVYLCPQPRFKFHPDFDAVATDILDRDPQATLAIYADPHPAIDRRYLARLPPRLQARISILPRRAPADFIATARAADIVLDTPHFSGGRTSFELLANGIPVVTWPGRFMRGRQTAGLYALAEIGDAVAPRLSEMPALAVALAQDADRRRVIGRAVAERAHRFTHHPDTIPAMTEALIALARGARP